MLPTVAYQPLPPAGHHYSIADVVDCPVGRRYIWLSRGLRMGDGYFAFILYHYVVQDYKVHSNKKRALFIFEHFLSPAAMGGEPNVDPHGAGINLSLNFVRRGAAVEGLDKNMKTCDHLRSQYVAASWWGRLKISFNDTRPPSWLFDDITKTLIDGGCGQGRADFLMKLDAGAQITAQSAYRLLVARLQTTRTDLIAASFDTERLGIDQIETCIPEQ